MSQLVDKKTICEKLNYTVKEVDELVRYRNIPFIEGIKPVPVTRNGQPIYRKGAPVINFEKAPGNILFPLEEILAKFTPKPKSAAKPKPQPEPEKVTEETEKAPF